MARKKSKALHEAEEFRDRVLAVLAEPHDWEHYEHVRYWLEKLTRRDLKEGFTDGERSAVDRIIIARTPFFAWDGYTVLELRRAAMAYFLDHNDDGQEFLTEVEQRDAMRLALPDMRHLVALARFAGATVRRFMPDIETSLKRFDV